MELRNKNHKSLKEKKILFGFEKTLLKLLWNQVRPRLNVGTTMSVEINILLDRLSIQDKSQEEMLIQQANALVNQEYTICLLESQVAQSV